MDDSKVATTIPAVVVVSVDRLRREAVLHHLATGKTTIRASATDRWRGEGGEVVVVDARHPSRDDHVRVAASTGNPVLVWGENLTDPQVQALERQGCTGYLSETATPRQLRGAIVELSRRVQPEAALAGTSGSPLTTAEKRALTAYLIEGAEQPRREVARRLGVSEATLKAQVSNVRAKLGATVDSRGRNRLRSHLLDRVWL